MTSELEKQFFDTFGIEPKFKGYSNTEELATGGVIPCGNIKYFNTIEEMDKANYWCFNMWELDEEDKEYPQISDRILLELICILIKTRGISFDSESTIEEIKEYVLKLLKWYREDSLVNDRVRTLFEER